MMPLHSPRPGGLAALLLAALLVACGGGSKDSGGETGKDGEEETPPVPVEVRAIERGDVFAVYTGTASLETDADAMVVAKVAGEVVQLLVEEGDRVKAGQVLARLDGDRLRLEMERAAANVRKLEQEYQRNVQLHEKGLVSSGAFEDLKYELEALKAALQLAKLEVSYTEIRAPITGVVAQRFIKLGNTISVNDPVFRVTNLDPLIAYLHVPEREFRRIEKGQQAELIVDAIPSQAFQATVQRISPVVDPETGTFKVTMEVPDPSARLKPGMFGRFNITWDARRDTLLVPREAIVDAETDEAVYIVAGELAERRSITSGYTRGDRVEVVEGLSGDEEVVVVGQGGLKQGARVEVVRRGDARVAQDAGTERQPQESKQ